MNFYSSLIKKTVIGFKEKANGGTYEKFLRFVKTGKLTKEVNKKNHICSFFLPYNRETSLIYLVDHIKAGSWIPPGGHVKLYENPVDTVIREYREELKTSVSKSAVNTFALSIINISKNKHSCKVHYDFWYLVHTPIIIFDYSKKEFNDGRWFGIDEAIKKITVKKYREIISNLKERR